MGDGKEGRRTQRPLQLMSNDTKQERMGQQLGAIRTSKTGALRFWDSAKAQPNTGSLRFKNQKQLDNQRSALTCQRQGYSPKEIPGNPFLKGYYFFQKS